MSITEEWRPIAGYEGFYEVSNLGRVRSLDRLVERAGRWGNDTAMLCGRILKQTPNSKGYLRVYLARDGGTITARVNRLVAKAFLEDPEAGKDLVCHKNGDPADNNVKNLRWDHQVGNLADTIEHGTRNHGKRHGLAKLDDTAVVAIRKEYSEGVLQRQIALKHGISRSNVSLIVTRKHWGHIPHQSEKAV